MKFRVVSLLVLCCALFAFSCSDDDNPTGSSGLDFKDQVLQGKIEGTSWLMQGGRAAESIFFPDQYRFEFVLTSREPAAMCEEFSFDGDQVLCTFPLAVGVVQLSNENTVTLLDIDTFTNVVASSGKFEIQSIDLVNKTASGRLVARFDDDNVVNGNFTVVLCD